MTPPADILIKLFSGPHLGAEIPLSSGTTVTLGSDSACDIILKDTTVAGRHLSVTVGDREVSVTILDAAATFVRGEKEPAADTGDEEDQGDTAPGAPEQVARGTVPWQARTLMMAGTSALAWRRAGEDWGDIAASSALLDSILTAKAEPAPEGNTADGAEKKPKAIPLPPMARHLLKGLGIVLIFLFVFGPCMGIKSTRMARNMKNLLEDENFGYLAVKQTNIGVTVTGTVATQADRGRLWQLAGKVDYPVFIDIRVDEERAYAVKVSLSVRGLFPEVSLREKDIIIKGYMRDKLIEGAAKVWIKSDISRVNRVESKMVYAFQVWPVLKDRLIKYGLDTLLVVRFHPGLVQVEGELSFDQRETLEKVKGEVCDQLNSPVAFWDTLTAPGFSQEWNDSLNASLRSRFAPDPGLAQLFLDSQSAKGVPAFVASTPAYTAEEGLNAVPGTPLSSVPARVAGQDLGEALKTAEIIEAEDGRRLAVIKDKDGKIKGAVLLDKEGKMVKTPSGEPIFLPVIRDKEGRVVKDGKGRPVFAEPLADGQGRPVIRPLGEEGLARDDEGRILADEQGRPVYGQVLRDRDGHIKRDEQGNILVKDKDGNIVATRPSEGPINSGSGQGAAVTGAVLDGEGNIVRDSKGNPVMGRPALDRDGRVVTDAKGRPVILGTALDKKGRPLRDRDGEPIPLTVARDAEGRVVRDKQGNPLLVPALLDKEGRVVRDKQGRPVAPRVISGADGRAVFDTEGRLIPDREANKAFTGEMPGSTPGEQGEASTGKDGKTRSDKEVFGSGTAVTDKLGQAPVEDPLGGLSITSITMKPIPFIGMRDGQKFFTGGKLPTGWVIRSIATDRITVEKKGKTKTIKMRSR